ncbi:uncharacterized protein MCYG_03316 [Microsporum canis CBS 113480]|uniref:Uncharacterized protein n=1 Tax=Arthroderma otae (strain ATCC MYA-4605 / CBS 113480) TaxID=554155 RepID=C5FLC5_ARTOC|nr:uncharacterized protein MCYG_03316 [Microsporum canis CBS 113480]EEQ30497.1 predicted protein [Microsporum canis CBS 113480]
MALGHQQLQHHIGRRPWPSRGSDGRRLLATSALDTTSSAVIGSRRVESAQQHPERSSCMQQHHQVGLVYRSVEPRKNNLARQLLSPLAAADAAQRTRRLPPSTLRPHFSRTKIHTFKPSPGAVTLWDIDPNWRLIPAP